MFYSPESYISKYNLIYIAPLEDAFRSKRSFAVTSKGVTSNESLTCGITLDLAPHVSDHNELQMIHLHLDLLCLCILHGARASLIKEVLYLSSKK